MSQSLSIEVRYPLSLNPIEFATFVAFVRAGGEVSIQGLPERINGAAALVMAKIDGLLVGIAALKNPQPSYRRRISSESGFSLLATEFPFELGWVYVDSAFRGQGISLALSHAAIAASSGEGVFATSRSDNAAMHRSLVKVGLVPAGQQYASGRGKHLLQVFIRHAQPIIPPDLPRQAAPGQVNSNVSPVFHYFPLSPWKH